MILVHYNKICIFEDLRVKIMESGRWDLLNLACWRRARGTQASDKASVADEGSSWSRIKPIFYQLITLRGHIKLCLLVVKVLSCRV